MKKNILFFAAFMLVIGCKQKQANDERGELQKLFDNYWEEKMQLFPLEATANGDNRYNNKMTITISETFRDSLHRFYSKQLGLLMDVDTAKLIEEDKLSYSIFKYEMEMNLEGLKYPNHYLPINQFWGLTLDLPQLGSGKGNQPFKTVRDYYDFAERISVFPSWVDTAIYNMRNGVSKGWVLPQALVVKILPQLKAMVVKDVKESIFYEPVKNFPDKFSPEEKQALTAVYEKMIAKNVVAPYKKLLDFMSGEYLKNARTTSGIGVINEAYYGYLVRNWTTTALSPDSIYNIGLHEVARIEAEMNKVKTATGYKSDLKGFFEHINTSPDFFPFSTAQQVIDSFWSIQKKEEPMVLQSFNHIPKTEFTIRQTEKFREASASAEYNPGSEDGTRPGIFYVPVPDARKFNATGMETLFLHEAIPGHHYQISLSQENKNIPKFRRFLWYGAYGEGWAMYSETLGRELGLYKDPYQYFGHLTDAMHRAIRLVVDVGMHTKGMTREEAIAYMLQHESVSEEEATREIERYMAIPGQALSYKIGKLTIMSLRVKYEKQLGDKFNLASFHDEVLKDGCVPLNILEAKLERWAKKR